MAVAPDIFQKDSFNADRKLTRQSDSSFRSDEGSFQLNVNNLTRSQTFFFYLIGILLTTTAVAKLSMLLTDPFADIRVGIPKWILWLSVAFESGLAFQNFRIRDYRILAFLDTTVFASFCIFAVVRWLLGYQLCGCSGQLELPIWVFILIDTGIVTWFVATVSGRMQFFAGLKSAFRRLQRIGRADWAGLLGGAALAWTCFALSNQYTVANSSENHVSPTIENIRVLETALAFDFVLVNQSKIPVEIVGFKSSCGCLVSTMVAGEKQGKLLPQETCVFEAKLDKTKIDTPLGMLWYIHSASGYSEVFFTFTISEDLTYETETVY